VGGNYEENSPPSSTDVTIPFAEGDRLGYIPIETMARKLLSQDLSTLYDIPNFETSHEHALTHSCSKSFSIHD